MVNFSFGWLILQDNLICQQTQSRANTSCYKFSKKRLRNTRCCHTVVKFTIWLWLICKLKLTRYKFRMAKHLIPIHMRINSCSSQMVRVWIDFFHSHQRIWRRNIHLDNALCPYFGEGEENLCIEGICKCRAI